MANAFRLGTWLVEPQLNTLTSNGQTAQVEPKVMQVLVCLAEQAGEVVSKEKLIQTVWADTFVTDDVLTRAISELRKVFGDDSKEPRFIQTIPKRGYRLIASFQPSGVRAAGEVKWIEEELSPAHRVGLAEQEQKDHRPKATSKTRLWKSLIASIIGILLATGFLWFYFPRSMLFPPMKVVRLTSFPGSETEPALSPDGKIVAFVWDGEKGDNADIYAMFVDSGKPVRLTTDPGRDFSPTWSPDGRFIAFLRESKEKSGIYLIPGPYREGPERKLAEGDFGGSLDWSPDGKSLVVSALSPNKPNFSLLLLSVETGEKKQITPPDTDLSD